MIEVRSGHGSFSVGEAVFFPFDPVSLPFSAGLRLQLVAGKIPGRPNPIVLGRGAPGAPDDARTRFYGTVIREGDELRMWYLARSSRDESRRDGNALRVCYATSRDGRTWERPELGLVEFHGSRRNNIVDLRGGRCDCTALPILYDPADANPERRYKMAFESPVYQNRFAVAYSADGLRWRESPHNPVGPQLEQTGLIRLRNCYYLNGQSGEHFVGDPRRLVTHASYDFEHWTTGRAVGLRRDGEPPRPVAKPATAGEEVHLGAGLWDRGNVILGVTDLWHGDPGGDRRKSTQDLGLLVSHDALHFTEPVPDFALVPAAGELDPAADRGPALSHGQGMVNLGEETLLFYEIWLHGGIRLATWPRDRLGYWTATGLAASGEPHALTCPFRPRDGAARVFVNADGLSQESRLTVEVWEEQFRPLAPYSGSNAVPLTVSGLRQPVVWKDRDALRRGSGPVRLRVGFGGAHPERIRLYALYVA